jgi:hypothetical protein
VKVGLALTAHRTVTMFIRYAHTEDDPVRAAADAVAFQRQALIGGAVTTADTTSAPAPIIEPETATGAGAEADEPLGFEDGNYRSRTKLGDYRPFRHRRGPNRTLPLLLRPASSKKIGPKGDNSSSWPCHDVTSSDLPQSAMA